VAGVTVLVFRRSNSEINSDCISWQKTGAKGEFSVSVKAGSYSLEVRSNGNRFLHESISEVLVSSNTTCNVNLTTGYLLTGHVSTINGDRLLEGSIVAQEIESSSYFSVASLENGRFCLVLPRGEYRIAYRALPLNQFSPSTKGFDNDNDKADKHFITPSYLTTDVTIVPISNDCKIEIVLPQLVRFRGKILDHAGSAVSLASVTVKPSEVLGSKLCSELGLAARCKSDESGNFQLSIQPGTYDFAIIPPKSSSLFTLKEERVSVYEDCTREFQMREGYRIEGKVLHQSRPVPDCVVVIFDASDQPNLNLQTDGAGQFQTTLPKGQYTILATVNDSQAENTLLGSAVNELIVSGKTSLTLNLEESIHIFGKVVDESLRIRTGVSVSAILTKLATQIGEATGRNAGLVLDHTFTDSYGRYHLHVAPGSYSILCNNDFNNAKFAEVQAEPLELDFTLPGWRQLSLEIVGEDGRRISNCRLGYAPYNVNNKFPEMHKYENVFNSQFLRGSKSSGGNNIIQIVLPSGLYTLEITPPKDSHYDGKLIRQLSLNNDIIRKVILPLKNNSPRSSRELRLA
jgi:hypothetical protein